MTPVRVHEYNEIVQSGWTERKKEKEGKRDRGRLARHTLIRIRALIRIRHNDDIIIMKQVISQSVNCTESKDGWACPGKSDVASNIPEGVVKGPRDVERRGDNGNARGSFINGY